MNLNSLSQGEPWMTPEERQHNHDFVHATTALLAARGIPETPLLLIRINDIIATWCLARRLETALTPDDSEAVPCPTPAQAGAIGKYRDRLRRAMKDFEACCPSDATPLQAELARQLENPAMLPPAPAIQDARTNPTGDVHTPRRPQCAHQQTAPAAHTSDSSARTALSIDASGTKTKATPPAHELPIGSPLNRQPPTANPFQDSNPTGDTPTPALAANAPQSIFPTAAPEDAIPPELPQSPDAPARKRKPARKPRNKRGCPRRRSS